MKMSRNMMYALAALALVLVLAVVYYNRKKLESYKGKGKGKYHGLSGWFGRYFKPSYTSLHWYSPYAYGYSPYYGYGGYSPYSYGLRYPYTYGYGNYNYYGQPRGERCGNISGDTIKCKSAYRPCCSNGRCGNNCGAGQCSPDHSLGDNCKE